MREGDWVYVITLTPERARKMSREGVDKMLRLEFEAAVQTSAADLDAWHGQALAESQEPA